MKNITINLKKHFNCDGYQIPMPKNFNFKKKLETFKNNNGELGYYGEYKAGELIQYREIVKNETYILSFNLCDKYKDLKFKNIHIGMFGVNLFTGKYNEDESENVFGDIFFIYHGDINEP